MQDLPLAAVRARRLSPALDLFLLGDGMNFKRTLRDFPIGCYIGLAFGFLLSGGGVFMFWQAHPSPHGYIELFLAMPTICLGLLFVAGSLLFAYEHINWPLRVLALVLLTVAWYPLVELARFLSR